MHTKTKPSELVSAQRLLDQGRYQEAIPLLRDGIEMLLAEYAFATQTSPERWRLSNAFYLLALALRPSDPGAARQELERARNLGLFQGDEDITQVIRAFYGETLLMLGDYVQGWAFWNPPGVPAGLSQQLAQRGVCRWQGESLTGKTIGVFAEWGLGDVILYARWLRALKQEFDAAAVVFVCCSALSRLLTSMPLWELWVDVAQWLPGASTKVPCPVETLPPMDCWTGLNSLVPRLAYRGKSPDAWKEPYLRAERSLVDHWAVRLADRESGRKSRVGIVWRAGSPTNGATRSLPVSAFRRLAALRGVQVYGLQVDASAAEVAKAPGLVSLAGEIADFADTAAVIANLDQLITCDTSVANLAGALGCPAWVLLPYLSDWRWGALGQPCSLYPTVRKFQQSVQGDWSGPLAEVMTALG